MDPAATPPGELDRDLLRDTCLIDGDWIGADSHGCLAVINPARGQTIGSVPDMGAAETTRAVAAAKAALPGWAARTAGDRGRVLRCLFELMQTHQEKLARLITAEQGKPLAEARGEVAYAASFIEWFAEEGKRIYGEIIPPPRADRRILALRQPVGVVAAITPWNFPIAMLTRKLGPALAAGCTVVAKPAPETPLSALAFAALAERAGVPRGVLNIVTGDARAIGSVLGSHPDVRKLSFTGSTATGRILLTQCASTVKKVSMELGGNAPFIVFDGADLDQAVAGAMVAKFRNAGQTCVCANRFYVQSSIHDAFVARLAEAVSTLVVGDGFAPGTDIGPLISEAALGKVERHVTDAIQHGAKLLMGGTRLDGPGLFITPAILTNVQQEMLVCREETFGPLAPVLRFDTEAEVIIRANESEVGLAAYLYERDIGRIFRVAEALEVGMVGVNTGLISTEVAPFGGIKQSGLGREGSHQGIEDYVETKYLCLAGLA
jgi:succinate-semialdehyde dehydrogenase/glutarate-semialdehyde dehydrogenase